jgi:hypothetical protein
MPTAALHLQLRARASYSPAELVVVGKRKRKGCRPVQTSSTFEKAAGQTKEGARPLTYPSTPTPSRCMLLLANPTARSGSVPRTKNSTVASFGPAFHSLVTRQVPETQPGMRAVDRVYVVRAASLVLGSSCTLCSANAGKKQRRRSSTSRGPRSIRCSPSHVSSSPLHPSSKRHAGVGHRPPATLRSSTTQAYFSHRQPTTHGRPAGGAPHLCGPSVTDTEATVAGGGARNFISVPKHKLLTHRISNHIPPSLILPQLINSSLIH